MSRGNEDRAGMILLGWGGRKHHTRGLGVRNHSRAQLVDVGRGSEDWGASELYPAPPTQV